MNSSTNDRLAERLLSASKINRPALLGVCLIVLAAVLFYGPVLLLLWQGLG